MARFARPKMISIAASAQAGLADAAMDIILGSALHGHYISRFLQKQLFPY